MVQSDFKVRRPVPRKGTRYLVIALTLACLPAVEAQAATTRALTPDQAITRCLNLIRDRYVSTGTQAGSYRMTLDVADHANIDPYFGLEAALGVLAAHARTDNPDQANKDGDLTKVGNFLLWYAKRIQLQNKTENVEYGVAHEYDGPLANPTVLEDDATHPTRAYDAIDSYAGLYLLACARYHRLAQGFPEPAAGEKSIEWALGVSINALQYVINKKPIVQADENATDAFDLDPLTFNNGLSIARGAYPVHFMLDNIETHAGLREIIPLYKTGVITGAVADPEILANALVNGTGLPRFDGIDNQGRYAYVIMNDNNPQWNIGRDTDALSNLAALSYLPSKGTKDGIVWQYVKRTYMAENANDDAKTYPPPQAPSERWLIAAKRVAPAEVASLETTVTNNVEGYQPITDIGRLGISILALIDGSARYPVLSDDAIDPNVAVTNPADGTINPH